MEDAARLLGPDLGALIISIVVLVICLRLKLPVEENTDGGVTCHNNMESQAEVKYRNMLNVLASIGLYLILVINVN